MLRTLARFVGLRRRVMPPPLWSGDEAAPTWYEISPGYIAINVPGEPLQPGFTPAHKIRDEQKAA